MKRFAALLLAVLLVCSLTACGRDGSPYALSAEPSTSAVQDEAQHRITLSGASAALDGSPVEEFDYVWHIDPAKESEWYAGEAPDTAAAVYIAHDVWYYPMLDETGFTRQVYDGETEWVYHYTGEGLTDYLFSTLPVLGNELPTEMMHSAEEAYENKVLHITQPGTYALSGTWHGQIMIDLGDKDAAFTDEQARITLLLSGVDVTCDCAPAFLGYSAYECDNAWEDRAEQSGQADTSDAGIEIIIADATENNFTGANVFRLLKAAYKKDGSTVQKKAHKMDGAFYSFVSMNIDSVGTGVLNIASTTYEGLDDELHLTINGGYINIYSQDDGINVNEDLVSVFTMNGGTLHIFAGLGAEGDCVDSNGYITINGGLIAAGTPSGSDEVLDSECGTTENGGQVIIIGSGRGMGGFPGGDFSPGGFGERPDQDGFGERPDLPDGAGMPGSPGAPEGGMTPPGGFGGAQPGAEGNPSGTAAAPDKTI